MKIPPWKLWAAAAGAAAVISAGAGAQEGRESAAEREERIRSDMQRIFLSGPACDTVDGWTPDDTALMAGILADFSQSEYWMGAAGMISVAAEADAARILINFIESWANTPDMDIQAARGASMAGIGLLVNRTGSREGLDYLIQGTDPARWLLREPESRGWFLGEPHGLSRAAVLGLAATAADEAGMEIERVARDGSLPPNCGRRRSGRCRSSSGCRTARGRTTAGTW